MQDRQVIGLKLNGADVVATGAVAALARDTRIEWLVGGRSRAWPRAGGVAIKAALQLLEIQPSSQKIFERRIRLRRMPWRECPTGLLAVVRHSHFDRLSAKISALFLPAIRLRLRFR